MRRARMSHFQRYATARRWCEALVAVAVLLLPPSYHGEGNLGGGVTAHQARRWVP